MRKTSFSELAVIISCTWGIIHEIDLSAAFLSLFSGHDGFSSQILCSLFYPTFAKQVVNCTMLYGTITSA